MTVPTVLNVGGIFAHTHKYDSSVAMLLDSYEWHKEQTGSVHENGIVARLFDMNLESSYVLVTEWIADSNPFDNFINWNDARQMIDILVEGRFWIVSEDSQGNVYATGYETYESAWDAYSLVEHDYFKSSGLFEPCGVCKEYGHSEGEHYDDVDDPEPETEKRSGSSYFNEAGEPLMTAAQARFEAYLDDEPREPYED